MKRRNFLKHIGTISAPLILSGRIFGFNGNIAPSNRVTLGMIGLGFLGRVHLHGLTFNPKAQIMALSDVDQWRLNDAQRMVQEGYSSLSGKNWKGTKKYHDFLDLLVRSDIDGVVITMGDRWHTTAVIKAVEAGKDVFVEKPVALTLGETKMIAEAVERTHRITQVGLQQRSDETFNIVCPAVRNGRLGKISHVYVCGYSNSFAVSYPEEPIPPTLDWDRWLGPAPWRPYNSRFHQLGCPRSVVPWSHCRDFGNGGIADATVHAFDAVQWGLGLENSGPIEIMPENKTDNPYLTYKLSNGVWLQAVPGRLDSRVLKYPALYDPNIPIQAFGALFLGENGWVSVARNGYAMASSPDLIADLPAVYYGNRPDAHNVPFVKRGPHYWTTFYDHKDNWLDCVLSRKQTVMPVRWGAAATRYSCLAVVARSLNRPLKWDPDRLEFINDDEANKLRYRAAREPWNFC